MSERAYGEGSTEAGEGLSRGEPGGFGHGSHGYGGLERLAFVTQEALDAGAVILCRPGDGRWLVIASSSRSGRELLLDDALASLVERQGAPVELRSESDLDIVPPLPAEFGSYLGVPVFEPAAGECLGVLAVLDGPDRRWSERDRDLVTKLAETVAAELGFARDLSERRALEVQLRQSQRMEAVGRLAGGIAHDFNNMLTAISGHAQLLELEFAQEHPLREHLDVIRMAADRSAALTRQLLAFSRKQILQPQVVELNGIVASMEPMLRRMIGEDIEVHTTLSRALPPIFADPSQVEQVLMNLVINARDAMPEGGKLVVSTAQRDLDESYFEAHRVQGRPGRYAVLAISDNGIGMDPLVQARIFEPFFTTKPVGKGTGLGLSTVYGIVKQTGGFVWVYSEAGIGTSFKVYLPLAIGSGEVPAPTLVEGTTRIDDATVLVVEDDPFVRLLVSRVLRRAGYTVLEAESGVEAARVVLSHDGPLDLLLTDVILPQMSGRTVADHIVQRSPETRVLFMSGYTDEAIVHHGVLDPNTDFIEKPFTPERLLNRVRAALEYRIAS